MASKSGELRLPSGFRFAGVLAGIKQRRNDLGLIVSESPATAAACLTQSALRAASVERLAMLLPREDVRAIVATSGNANALTGLEGRARDRRMAEVVASVLDVNERAVLTTSTGVIGIPFPVEKVEAAAQQLARSLGPDPMPFAEALLTTDTRTKITSREFFAAGKPVRVLGIAKGSGMVHPNMATVLGYVLTDAAVSPAFLSSMLRQACTETWNGISVDGDTSTNDAVIALANRASGVTIFADTEGGRALVRVVQDVMRELAMAIARDGEGARRLVRVDVRGAETVEDARAFARAVAGSNLVKAAVFGADPNVGRVLAALGAEAGRRGRALTETDICVSIAGISAFAGAPVDFDADAIRARLRHDEVTIGVDLGRGSGKGEAFGCDLSYDYVRINADYAAVVIDQDTGAVRRDTRLDVKTPEMKTAFLVAALGHIARFSGTRAVIRFGKETLSRPELCASFAEDVRLLKAVGLRPVLVQGEATSESLVAELARIGVRAVSLSGADGHLLRWDAALQLTVDIDLIETLLGKEYVPVVVPELTELTDTPVDVDEVAALLAVAIGARKVIFLGDSTGITAGGMLVSEVSLDELAQRIDQGHLDERWISRGRAAVKALRAGVDRVHFIDERIAHNVVAELFTDTGVGTMVR